MEELKKTESDLYVIVDTEIVVTSPGSNRRGPRRHAFA